MVKYQLVEVGKRGVGVNLKFEDEILYFIAYECQS